MHALDGYGVQVDAIEAANIDRPHTGRCAGTPEGEDTAGLAEVVSRDMGVEGVEREIIERGEQPEALGLDPMDQGSALPADRAVADADVIQVGIDLEPDATAVAGAAIGLFHRIIPLSQNPLASDKFVGPHDWLQAPIPLRPALG